MSKGYAKMLIGGFGRVWVIFEHGKRVGIITIRTGYKAEQMAKLRHMGYRIRSGYSEVKGKKRYELWQKVLN